MKTNGTGVCSGLLIIFLSLTGSNSFAQLKADFSSNVQSGCAPLIVVFEDNSTGNPVNWTWTLGNGTTATNQNPTTTYFDAGTYQVTLSIKNAAGKDSITKQSYITVYANPEVAYSVTPTQGCYPLAVKFTSSSKAGSGTISKYLWDYGDGNIDTMVKASHTYISAGVFDITLKVTNSYGCYSAVTKSDLIKINDGVNAAFSLTALNICKSPAAAVFQNASEGSGTISYQWSFGDNTTSTEESPTHSYKTSGNYNVLLTARSTSGCSDTASFPLVVHFPVTSLSYTKSLCLNKNIQFTNTSVPAPVSCTWYFGDGTTSTELNPNKTYTKTGNYTVKLVNVFSTGCADSSSKNITIETGPSAILFNADDTLTCIAPLSVNFTNKTSGAASGYLWDFGDGTTSTDINPKHIYTTQGSFTVKLTATNANGCDNALVKTSYINIQPVKITGIKNLPDSGCVPLIEKPSVVLNSTYTIKKYTWDFGDGSTSTSEFPIHTYTKQGIFNVKVTIETTGGCTDTYILPNAVFAGHKPKASFSAIKDTICGSETPQFVSTSTNGPISFLSWNNNPLLDSVTGKYFFLSHASDTGYIPVRLVAFNYGCSDTLDMDSAVYVLAPISKISYLPHCEDKQRIDFIDKSIADITHTWDFGDSIKDASKNPTHVYAAPGYYTAKLLTTNKACVDSQSVQIHIINEVGTLSIAKTIFCRGNNFDVDIAGINLDNIANTTWDFGDGSVITVNGATKSNHIYTIAGRFKIKATMIDKNSCRYYYETKDSVTIYGPLAGFVSNEPGACQGNNISFTDKSSSDGIHTLTKWSWNFGDGEDYDYTKASPTYSHVYKDTGYKSIRVSVTDSYGCTDSAKRYNYVYISHPYASYILSDSIACPGKQISFQNTSTGKELIYTWHFGDGSQSDQANPSYTYKKSGIYNPQLLVTDINGCVDSFHLNGLTISKPVATFNLSATESTCPPLEVNFTNQSSDYTSSTWSFGDGSPSVITSPTHVYTYPGIYPVKLIVKGYGVCADTSIIKNITIKGPTGKMVYDAHPVCYPYTTQFSAIAKNAASYTWDFSDGNTAATQDAKTAYQYQPGNYLPKLILQDAAGCKVSIKGNDTLKIYDVVAKADVSAAVTCFLNPVQFTDQSTSADNIIHHYWFFGDKNIEDTKATAHTYASEGNYDAFLIAETRLGCRDTFNFPAGIKILPKPEISIAAEPAACSGATINYTGTSAVKDNTIIWKWNFGNGNTATGETTSTTYSKGGNYDINLIASNAGGCSDTAKHALVVHASPIVQAPDDTIICQGGNFQLTASGAQTYTWAGSGLSCTGCSSPTINVNDLATYYVSGKDAFGCSGSDSVTVNVVKPSKISVSDRDTLCVGETTKLTASGANSFQWYPSTYLDNDKAAQPVFTAARDTSITYKVIGRTARNCFADTGYVSVKAYPVPKLNIAQNEIVLNVGSSVQLHANSSADVTTWRWQPAQGLNSTVSADPVASPIQSTTYSCIASNGGACVARDEITINVICGGSNVFIPNTFSPNNDGMNDVFYPRGKGLFKIKSVRIFNRWGQIMFEKANASPNAQADGWDGKFNGKLVNTDVYVYIIEVLCENNTVIPFKGNVTLVR